MPNRDVRGCRYLLSVAIGVGVLLSVGVGNASAAVVFDGSPGTSAPPATLGGYTMSAFGADPAAHPSLVTTAPGPTGNVTFDEALTHAKVGPDWTTWSNGYTGDVYYTSSSPNRDALGLTLPPGAGAFYFYVEPANVGPVDVTATTNAGTTSGPVSVAGSSGARYFGFHTTTPGETITSIGVSAPAGANGFAVGQFAIAQVLPVDKTKPTLGSFRFSTSVFKAATSGASTSAKRKSGVPIGTKVSFNVSEASSVKFTVQRKTRGRKVRGKCKAKTHGNHSKPKCARYTSLKGSFTVAGKAGKNTLKFRGRVGGKSLKPGSYRLTATATDPSKNTSVPKRKGFKIVK
jgi:hypothetical protein